MHTPCVHRFTLSLVLLAGVAGALLAGASLLGLELTLGAIAAIAVGAVLVLGGATFLHDAIREARWNAGHRLR